jgi:mRNA interferase RelE/StbE
VTERPYEMASTPSARKALGSKAGTAVVEFLYGPLTADPHRLGKPLKRALDSLRSARRGDYRVLCRIDEEAHRVEVVVIEHRSDLYRRR